jgi:hypothetical protein
VAGRTAELIRPSTYIFLAEFEDGSFSNSILKSSIEVRSTTIADPRMPATNIASMTRINREITKFIRAALSGAKGEGQEEIIASAS